MTTFSKRLRLLATVALAAIALSTAPAISGPGKSGDRGGGHGGGGKGHGKASGDFTVSQKGNKFKSTSHGKPVWAGSGKGKPVEVEEECAEGGDCETIVLLEEEEDYNDEEDVVLLEEDDDEDPGYGKKHGKISSELKALNGPVHASARAMERASDKSIIGQARIWRDSVLAEEAYTDKQDEYDALVAELDAKQTIQNEIDGLNPDDPDDALRIEELNSQLESTRTEGDILADMETVEGELDAMEDPEVLAQNSEDAYSDLTDDRSLSEEAYAVLRSALGLD